MGREFNSSVQDLGFEDKVSTCVSTSPSSRHGPLRVRCCRYSLDESLRPWAGRVQSRGGSWCCNDPLRTQAFGDSADEGLKCQKGLEKHILPRRAVYRAMQGRWLHRAVAGHPRAWVSGCSRNWPRCHR